MLEKTDLLMNLKNRMLLTEIEYYQEIRNIKNKKKVFQKLSIFSKLILLILGFLFLYVGLLGFVVAYPPLELSSLTNLKV